MMDIKLIRDETDKVRDNIKYRGTDFDIDAFVQLDKEWKEAKQELEEKRALRNKVSEEINAAIKQNQRPQKQIDEMRIVSSRIKELEKLYTELDERRSRDWLKIPNFVHKDVPQGKDERENKEIHRWGDRKQKFELKDHLTLLQNLNLIDLDKAGEIAGAGFVYLKGDLVLLDHAMQRFALDFLLKKGFTLMEPPFMVLREPYEGLVEIQEFEDTMFKIQDEDLYLIATAEHGLVPHYMNTTIPEEELPLRLAGVSPAFRKEIGSHGKYTKGLFRMKQFNKIEQVSFAHPDQSWEEFTFLQTNSEEILKELEIPYRTIVLCTGDLGTMKAMQYDNEFLMADGEYREIGSCGNFTDFPPARP